MSRDETIERALADILDHVRVRVGGGLVVTPDARRVLERFRESVLAGITNQSERAAERPHVCPKCDGTGIGPYLPVDGIKWSNVCTVCNGEKVLWVIRALALKAPECE